MQACTLAFCFMHKEQRQHFSYLFTVDFGGTRKPQVVGGQEDMIMDVAAELSKEKSELSV